MRCLKRRKRLNRSSERLDIKEWISAISVYIVLAVAAAMLFYDSLAAALVFAPGFPLFIRYVKNSVKRKREEQLTEEFLRCLSSVSTSLSAGISPENAFAAAASDMEKMYGSRSVMKKELDTLNLQTATGTGLADALFDLAARIRIADVYDFAVVFAVAKEKGANLGSVISRCVGIMEQKIEAETEAAVMIRSKQYEQRIMCIIPPGIIAYLRLSSAGFIRVLYHNSLGIVVMSVCLLVYVFAIWLSERIGDIRV